MRPIWSAGAMPLPAICGVTAFGWIMVYTLRMNVVAAACGPILRVHGVGLAETFL